MILQQVILKLSVLQFLGEKTKVFKLQKQYRKLQAIDASSVDNLLLVLSLARDFEETATMLIKYVFDCIIIFISVY